MRRNLVTVIAAAIFAPLMLQGTAQAAPQILGLLASAGPIPLTCENGVCTAEVTTVCLQQHRKTPVPGTAYKLAPGTDLKLQVSQPGGKQIEIATAQTVSMKSLRNFSSAQISLPESIARPNGTGIATITIGTMASAIPVAVPGDDNPMTEQEIAAYTGPLRGVAHNTFQLEAVNVATARFLNQVLNRLPDNEIDDREMFNAAWKKATAKDAGLLSPEIRGEAERVAADCRGKFDGEQLPNVRTCLEYHHDVLATETTKKIWKAMKPGG